uniref:UPF0472 protein C16orf72 n=1 Tax=Camelus bactrianus TaxID=9837 RepID=A0A9W3HH62_CAMBA|nr:UPF0472 protein C16orf72 [Camelus bactrianus]
MTPPCMATAVAQLYKDTGCQQPGLSMWDPFQNAAMALTSLYKESGDAHQRSFDLGIQVGNQRRIKDVLEWVKKGRSTILREDLISFLCDKMPPAPPRRRSSFLEDDLNPNNAEELALRLDSGGTRKRPSAQCGDSDTDSPTHKRNRMA